MNYPNQTPRQSVPGKSNRYNLRQRLGGMNNAAGQPIGQPMNNAAGQPIAPQAGGFVPPGANPAFTPSAPPLGLKEYLSDAVKRAATADVSQLPEAQGGFNQYPSSLRGDIDSAMGAVAGALKPSYVSPGQQTYSSVPSMAGRTPPGIESSVRSQSPSDMPDAPLDGPLFVPQQQHALESLGPVERAAQDRAQALQQQQHAGSRLIDFQQALASDRARGVNPSMSQVTSDPELLALDHQSRLNRNLTERLRAAGRPLGQGEYNALSPEQQGMVNVIGTGMADPGRVAHQPLGGALTGQLNTPGDLRRRLGLEQALSGAMENHNFNGAVARQDANGRAYFREANDASNQSLQDRLAYAQARQREREAYRGNSPSGPSDGLPLTTPQMVAANRNHAALNRADPNPLFSDVRGGTVSALPPAVPQPPVQLASAPAGAAPAQQAPAPAFGAADPAQAPQGPLSFADRLAQRQASVVANAAARAEARRNRLAGGGGPSLMDRLMMRNPAVAAQMMAMQQRGQMAQQELGLERERLAQADRQAAAELALKEKLGMGALKQSEAELEQGNPTPTAADRALARLPENADLGAALDTLRAGGLSGPEARQALINRGITTEQLEAFLRENDPERMDWTDRGENYQMPENASWRNWITRQFNEIESPTATAARQARIRQAKEILSSNQ